LVSAKKKSCGSTVDDVQESPAKPVMVQASPNTDDDFDERENLGLHILRKWKKRRPKMVSDYCTAGWMLSPDPRVMKDVKEHHRGRHVDATERLLVKLFYKEHQNDPKKIGEMKIKFATEFSEFQAKAGKSYDHRYVWLFLC